LHAIFDLTPLKVDFNEYFTLYSFILQNATNKLVDYLNLKCFRVLSWFKFLLFILKLINFYPKIVEFSGHVLLYNQDELKKGKAFSSIFHLREVTA
jgi:hypothetical protein